MMEYLVVCKERYGQMGWDVKYVANTRSEADAMTALQPPNRNWISLSQFLMSVFLPHGYPDSVSADYLEYQLWDAVQAFASSITGTLATEAVLKGIGVGDETATPMAATITWLLKDGTGMVGRIVFAWVKGSDLDCNCKRWRLMADILNDAAIFLDLLAPMFNKYITLMLCFSGVCRALVGVAGGATRAALVQHQALRDNLADVSAKDGSQETMINLIALVFSLFLLPAISGNQTVVWMLFGSFTALHLYANYAAISSVVMSSLNRMRVYILLGHYLSSAGEVLTPIRVAQLEPIFLAPKFPLKINLGCSFKKVASSYKEFKHLWNIQGNSKYLLNYNRKNDEINILLHQNSDVDTQIEACYEAMVIAYCQDLIFKGTINMPNQQLDSIIGELEQGMPDNEKILTLTNNFKTNEFRDFVKAIVAHGWNSRLVLLDPDEWRAVWSVHGLEKDGGEGWQTY